MNVQQNQENAGYKQKQREDQKYRSNSQQPYIFMYSLKNKGPLTAGIHMPEQIVKLDKVGITVEIAEMEFHLIFRRNTG